MPQSLADDIVGIARVSIEDTLVVLTYDPVSHELRGGTLEELSTVPPYTILRLNGSLGGTGAMDDHIDMQNIGAFWRMDGDVAPALTREDKAFPRTDAAMNYAYTVRSNALSGADVRLCVKFTLEFGAAGDGEATPALGATEYLFTVSNVETTVLGTSGTCMPMDDS